MEINLELVYVIFGIIYFLYSMWKNFSQKPVTRQEEESVEEEPSQRPHRRETVSKPFDEKVGRPINREPSSFEELLEEFNENSERARRKAAGKVKKVQEVDDEYEPATDEADRRFAELEAEKRIRETEARKVLQEETTAYERAEVTEEEVSRKIEQSIAEDSLVREEDYKKNKSQSQNRRRQRILEMLREPDNVTNTILASEILKRKYF